jgi:hypothetical protein
MYLCLTSKLLPYVLSSTTYGSNGTITPDNDAKLLKDVVKYLEFFE